MIDPLPKPDSPNVDATKPVRIERTRKANDLSRLAELPQRDDRNTRSNRRRLHRRFGGTQ